MNSPHRELVMIPGLLCDEAVFEGQRAVLSRHATVRVMTPTEDDTLSAMAARMLSNAPERFSLAGFSMGGYVAFEAFRLAPERIERLALLDTSPHPDTPERADLRLKMIDLARRGKLSQVIGLNYPFWVHARRANDQVLARSIRDMNARVGPDAYIRQQRAILGRSDARPLLRDIRCPTLVLCGDDDRLTPPSHHREMADLIPHARLVVVPECGHMSTMEHPEAVAAALADWLAA
jgi:pimeloyl-ACP methyl ester carboxylesterase